FERDRVAEPMLTGKLQHLRADEALEQAENVGVRTRLHVAQSAALLRAQELELVDFRQAARQEGPAVVEVAAANHVSVDFPRHALRGLHTERITRIREARGGHYSFVGYDRRFHGQLLGLVPKQKVKRRPGARAAGATVRGAAAARRYGSQAIRKSS